VGFEQVLRQPIETAALIRTCWRRTPLESSAYCAVSLLEQEKHRQHAEEEDRCFTPEKSQQRIALFGQTTKALSLPTGIFAWDHPYMTGQFLAVGHFETGTRDGRIW
jgi:hypothetical protein